jgi:phospholipid-binding lipoprotein MlaA
MIVVTVDLKIPTKKLFMALVSVCLVLAGCSAAQVMRTPEEPPKRPASVILKKGITHTIDAYDPLERMNRRIYVFNAKFDKYFFLPVVHGYEFVTPGFMQAGITNVFSNLGEITTLANSILQYKIKKAGTTTGRMLINTTAGVGGCFDVAASLCMRKQQEDFGQTLGFYCVGPGPYLVLPVLGPSTVRDTGGLIADNTLYNAYIRALIGQMDMKKSDEDALRYSLMALGAIDKRHSESFRYYETESPFEYELVRLLYLKKREIMIQE